MDPQEVNATALTAASTFCVALGDASLANVMYVADTFAAYITGGSEAAFRLQDELAGGSPTAVPPPAPSGSPTPPATETGQAERVAPKPEQREPSSAVEPPVLAEQGAGPSSFIPDSEAHQKVLRIKHERARQGYKKIAEAKGSEERMNIFDEMDEAGLLDFEMSINGEMITMRKFLEPRMKKAEAQERRRTAGRDKAGIGS